MKISESLLFVIAWGFSVSGSFGQILTLPEAGRLALMHNYDIKIANANGRVASNSATRKNSGYLPTVQATAGSNMTYNSGENRLTVGDQKFDARSAFDYNASVSVNYVLIDNNGRKYNYQNLIENENLTHLQAKQIIENTLLALAIEYHNSALLQSRTRALQSTLEVSKARHSRAASGFETGQVSNLTVLNALIDMQADSLNVINTERQLAASIRNLNLLLGRDLEIPLEIDSTVTFNLTFSDSELMGLAAERNLQILATDSRLRSSQFAMRAARSGWFPSISAGASYNFRGARDPNGPFVIGSYSVGPRLGLSLNWNLFDGGRTSTEIQNAGIISEMNSIDRDAVTATSKRDMANAIADYRGALDAIKIGESMQKSARESLTRSEDQLTYGTITSMEFRQAQTNAMNAEIALIESTYNAKNAELTVKKIAGLLTLDF